MEVLLAATVGVSLLGILITIGSAWWNRSRPTLPPANPAALEWTYDTEDREWKPALTKELRDEIYQTPEWWDKEFTRLGGGPKVMWGGSCLEGEPAEPARVIRHRWNGTAWELAPREEAATPEWPASFPPTSHEVIRAWDGRALRLALGAGTGNMRQLEPPKPS